MPYIHTLAHQGISLQVAKFGPVEGLSDGDFSLGSQKAFLLKNDNDDTVILEVMPVGESNWVETKFAPGWNPELIKAIKQNAEVSALVWGY